MDERLLESDRIRRQFHEQEVRDFFADRPELLALVIAGNYRLGPAGHEIVGLLPTGRTPLPFGRGLQQVFSIDEEAQALPARKPARLHRTKFLAKADSEKLGCPAWMNAIGAEYTTLGNLSASEVSTQRAEVRIHLKEAADRVTYHLQNIALPFLAVVCWETIRAVCPHPNNSWAGLSNEARKRVERVEGAFGGIWRRYLVGVPEAEMIAQFRSHLLRLFPEAPVAFIDFQIPILSEHLRERDEMIAEVIPLEFRRLACEEFLWKLAHGKPLEPWTGEDSKALRPSRGRPQLIADAVPRSVRVLIVEKYVELIRKYPDKYNADPRKGQVSDFVKIKIVGWLEKKKDIKISEETVRKYVTLHLDAKSR